MKTNELKTKKKKYSTTTIVFKVLDDTYFKLEMYNSRNNE